MTKVSLIFSTLLLIYLPSTNASEDIVGTRFLYSTGYSSQYVVKLKLNKDYTGQITYPEGTADITYSNGANGLDIRLSEELASESQKSIIHGDDDNLETIETYFVLKSLKITKKDSHNMQVLETRNKCVKRKKGTMCTNKQKIESDYVTSKKAIRPINIVANIGTSIVLPAPNNDSIFIKLEENQKVKVLNIGKTKIAHDITSWTKIDDKLIINLKDGGEITYTAILNIEGVQRVIAEYTSKDKNTIFSGALALDQSENMPSLTKEDVIGRYRLVLGSSVTWNATYFFDEDGVGGFHNYFLTDEMNIAPTYYSWKIYDNTIVANSYSRIPFDASYRDEIKNCEVSRSCKLKGTREYKILSRSGNRMTVLRYLNIIPSETFSGTKSLDIWTYYKQ